MTTIIEAVFEHGVLKPIDAQGLHEQRRYRVIVEEITDPAAPIDDELAAKLAQRTTVLPGGRTVVNLLGLFEDRMSHVDADQDPVNDALDELRREHAVRFAAEVDNDYGTE